MIPACRYCLTAIFILASTSVLACSLVHLDTQVAFNTVAGVIKDHGVPTSVARPVALYRGWKTSNRKPIREVQTGLDGRFDFGRVPAGHYSVLITLSGDRKSGFPLVVLEDARPFHSWVYFDYRGELMPDCSGLPMIFVSVSLPNKFLRQPSERPK